MKQLLRQKLTTLLLLLVSCGTIWADDFTVERAVNLSQLDSWADISKFQWEEINQFIQDNGAEMDALKEVFRDPAPKDTVGFYKQIFDARDNQYIVLRLDKAQGNRPFHVRVTCIKSTTDPSLNNTKVFSANNYAYIMPPITENQIEVKIWPQGQSEETAKTYTFNSHSYGSASVRSVMLDKSRIVDGDYTLQLIRYNSDTQLSDTTYINSLQIDKLYTFYDYDGGDLVEAYLMTNGFKRIKLDHEWWARDAVTHVSDNTVSVSTGASMPYNKHKHLEAPNPTYLDSRLFSYHDTLWVHLFCDNEPYYDTDDLTMHAVRSDTINKPIGEELLKWGKDPMTGRLYVLTEGEPATIECYRDGFLPKLCLYPGSYNHATGIIDSDREEVDIFLESIPEPVTSPKVTSSILSTLTPTLDRRGDFYVSSIQSSDILPVQTTETVYYDEYASHKDTMKLADDKMYYRFARMEVAIVAPKTYETSAAITLMKAKNDAEENAILNDNLPGDTRPITSPLFDYKYWITRFNLNGYLDINTSGRPAVAFAGDSVRVLPILYNKYLDLEKMKADALANAAERLQGDEAQKAAEDWTKEMAPAAYPQLTFNVPMKKPFYARIGLELDFFKTKKLQTTLTLGVGTEEKYDLIETRSRCWPNEMESSKLQLKKADEYDFENQDLSANLMYLQRGSARDEISRPVGDLQYSAYAELYSKFSLPLSLEGNDWKHWFRGMKYVDEVGLRAEATASANFTLDFRELLQTLSKIKGMPDIVKKFNFWANLPKVRDIVDFYVPRVQTHAAVNVSVNTGLYSFQNTLNLPDPLKNHALAFKFFGQASINGSTGTEVPYIVAVPAVIPFPTLIPVFGDVGFELKAGAGAGFKYALGSRLDFQNEFSGSAWNWFANASAKYWVKLFFWKVHQKTYGWEGGNEHLLTPTDFSNPFHKNFAYYLSDDVDPDNNQARAAALPGNAVSSHADTEMPVKFIAGGESIVYQGNQGDPDDPNKTTVEVASLGNPSIISDWRTGGCSDYDAASVPGLDLAVMEQATATVTKEQLEDSLTLDVTVNQVSRIYDLYYTKKNAGTKWYKPKPIYSSPETASYRPRLAMADDGKAIVIWQEGTIKKGSWVQEGDTVQLSDLMMNGHLMMSRFDGNETWSEPVKLVELNEDFCLKDYRVAYDGTSAFIVARRSISSVQYENVGIMVDGNNTVTKQTMDDIVGAVGLHRVGDYNLVSWMTIADSTKNEMCVRIKSFGIDGKEKKGINSSLIMSGSNIDEFVIVPDMEAKSLNNVALLWREQVLENDTVRMCIRASRLVPNQDGSFHLGTPVTAVQTEANGIIHKFDGYMTKEKIDVCFVGTDQEGNTQLNRKAVYFGNAFAYTVDFDPEENQGFQSHKDLITLLVTVTNYGTSTIKNCVLTVGNDKTYPLNMTVAAGQSVPERVNIPYTMGTGIDTKMTVEYDDVLGLSDEEQISKNSSRAMANAGRRGQNIREQNTALFFPYKPKLKCFVVAQRVDKNGDNYITICVRNYSRRRLPKKFAIIVGLKDTSYGSIVYNTKGNDHIKYGTKTLLCNLEDDNMCDGYMYDCGSYRAGYVTIKVPGVTEKEKMYVGATLAYKVPLVDIYIGLRGGTFCGSDNSGVVTLYPSSEVVSVQHVFSNGDKASRMHVSRSGDNLVVSGVRTGENVRLYQANGTVLARKTAGEDGKAVFPMMQRRGVVLISSGNETVKFAY